MKSLSLVASLCLLPALCPAEKPKAEQVQKELKEVISAVFVADMGPIAKHTHDRVIAIVGDRKTFLAEIEKIFKQVKENGVSLVSAEVGKDIDYFSGEQNEFLLVATNIVMKVDDEQQAVPGHQLGVKTKAETVWKYIDCSSLTTELAREWFPDFPKDKKIPEPKQEEGEPAPE